MPYLKLKFNRTGLTKFQKKVYNVVQRIPRGKVTTYKKIAKVLGNVELAQAVGNALKKNPWLIKIPCHRVIRSDKNLGGYKLGTRRKKELLIAEGIRLDKNNKIDKRYIINL